MRVRFTAWMDEAERDALERIAKKEHSSINFVLRSAIRAYIELSDPSPKKPKKPKQERA